MTKKLSILFIIVLIPVFAWLYAKPLRLFAPTMNSVHCTGSVCVENRSEMNRAVELYKSAVKSTSDSGIPFKSNPTFVYCSTRECYQSFGGGNERAMSYPFLGTIIAPESWQRHISQHELIHWFQFSEIGSVSTMMKPEWFREGMAYVYSGAPKSDIPEHYLPMMQQYLDWHSDKSWAEVIQQAENL